MQSKSIVKAVIEALDNMLLVHKGGLHIAFLDAIISHFDLQELCDTLLQSYESNSITEIVFLDRTT